MQIQGKDINIAIDYKRTSETVCHYNSRSGQTNDCNRQTIANGDPNPSGWAQGTDRALRHSRVSAELANLTEIL